MKIFSDNVDMRSVINCKAQVIKLQFIEFVKVLRQNILDEQVLLGTLLRIKVQRVKSQFIHYVLIIHLFAKNY